MLRQRKNTEDPVPAGLDLKDFDVEKFSEVTSALLDNKQEISAVLAKDKKE